MHAIRQYEFGPAENLLYEQVADPEPGAGQVRIAVRAAGIHLLDTAIRQGMKGGPFPPPDLPMTPGREVAGVVDKVGPDVDAGWLGRRAVAHLGMASGGYAELAVANVASVHEIPAVLSDGVAVAMIGTGRTTMGILDDANLRADDVVLVPAAAGGIGNLLVQYALNLGAVVVGLAGGEAKVSRVRELGATIAVDYTQPDWPAVVRDALGEREITVLLDGVGGKVGRAALDLVGIGARVLFFGWTEGEQPDLSLSDIYGKGLTVTVPIGPKMMRRPGGLRPLEEKALAEAASGRWVPFVNPAFPLADAATAHVALETRGTVGKVVLAP